MSALELVALASSASLLAGWRLYFVAIVARRLVRHLLPPPVEPKSR